MQHARISTVGQKSSHSSLAAKPGMCCNPDCYLRSAFLRMRFRWLSRSCCCSSESEARSLPMKLTCLLLPCIVVICVTSCTAQQQGGAMSIHEKEIQTWLVASMPLAVEIASSWSGSRMDEMPLSCLGPSVHSSLARLFRCSAAYVTGICQPAGNKGPWLLGKLD